MGISPDGIAQLCIDKYTSLPAHGKPRKRSNGPPEWTVLAGLVLVSGPAHLCVSLGTGVKATPYVKLSPHGDVLHDCHAEIIARRGMLLWLMEELKKGEKSLWLEQRSDGGRWRFREAVSLHLFISTLPCGDASMATLAAAQDPEVSAAMTLDRPPAWPAELLASLPALATTTRGRDGYDRIGATRTKPGRHDSRPSLSMSCSDKIALWLACGLQGSLLSSIFEPLYIDTVLVAPPAQSTHKAAHELERALWQRVSPCSTRSLPPTFHLCRADLPPALAPSIDMLPSPLSLSDIEGLGAEAIANGVRQGAAAALPSSRPPLRQSSRSRLCKRDLFQRFLDVQPSLQSTAVYADVKRDRGLKYREQVARSDRGMADVIALLRDALADGPQQPAALKTLSDAFTAAPHAVSTVFRPLLDNFAARSDVFQSWIVNELVEPALTRHLVSPDAKVQLAQQALPFLTSLLADQDLRYRRQAVTCFAAVYPLLFRQVCLSNDEGLWTRMTEIKQSIIAGWSAERSKTRVVATKFIQRVIQTQTRAGGDPRTPNRGEPNLGLVPSRHPFLQPTLLEAEAEKLLGDLIKALYMSQDADLISAIVTSLGLFLRARPAFAQLIVTGLVSWDPAAALVKGSPLQVRSVEKTIRITLAYLLRTGQAGPYTAQITGFLHAQSGRMQKAAETAHKRRDEDASRKRSHIADVVEQQSSSKRRKIGSSITSFADAVAPVAAADQTTDAAASFDVTTLPVNIVIELIIANLQAVPSARLASAIDTIKTNLSVGDVKPKREEGPVNPLEMDDDDDDLDALEADAQEQPAVVAAAPAVALDTFELPPPDQLPPEVERKLLVAAVDRICSAGVKARATGVQADMWLSLLARLITRGLDGASNEVRTALFDFIASKPGEHIALARIWLNEEWFGAQRRKDAKLANGDEGAPATNGDIEKVDGESDVEQSEQRDPYSAWLQRLLDLIVTKHFDKEGYRAVAQFIVDLPLITRRECRVLATMCESVDQSKLQAAFSALRDLALLRPAVRTNAVDMLLSLATHTATKTRNAAIITMRKWVPEEEALSDTIKTFALSLLTRLEGTPPASPIDENASEDGETTDDRKPEGPPCADVLNGLVVGALPYPSTELQVSQHLDLLLGMSINLPELLDEVFKVYPSLSTTIQGHVQTLILPPIKRLASPREKDGIGMAKVLSLIETAPTGCDSLVLRILGALSDKGRMAEPLSKLIKTLAVERDLSARFLIPIIGELDKGEILRRLPRIVALLNGTPAERETVRSVFEAVLTTNEQAFGALSTNVPRVRQTDLLTPVELLMLLHSSEKETGLKQAIEAINICFSMTNAFTESNLAAFMASVAEEPDLPTLFLRTVLQAVSTYPNLAKWVSTTLLSRLVMRKIWTTPQLWEGFMRCAVKTKPTSFGALIILPKEQLREVVHKQSTLRGPLQEYIAGRTNLNAGRKAALIETVRGGEDLHY